MKKLRLIKGCDVSKITNKDIAWALFDNGVVSYSDVEQFLSSEYSPLIESIVKAFRDLEKLNKDANESLD